MAKPTIIPTWATGGSARIVTPPTAKRGIGWQRGEMPPDAFLNWLFNHAGQWFQWLNDYEATAHTWTAKQTFNGAAASGAAADLIASAAFGLVPSTSGRKLEIEFTGVDVPTRIYKGTPDWGANGVFELVYNAFWTGTEWERDLGGMAAYALRFTSTGVFVLRKDAATWGDIAWDIIASFDGYGIHGSNLPKAQGVVDLTTTGVVMAGAVNLSTFSDLGSGLGRVTFSRAMADALYMVQLTIGGTRPAGTPRPNYVPHVYARTADHFEFYLDTGTVGPDDLSSGGTQTVHLHVLVS